MGISGGTYEQLFLVSTRESVRFIPSCLSVQYIILGGVKIERLTLCLSDKQSLGSPFWTRFREIRQTARYGVASIK